jgi:hypothetical protein
MRHGAVAIHVQATIRKRIRCDVENAHYERSLSQLQHPGADVPLEDWPHAPEF